MIIYAVTNGFLDDVAGQGPEARGRRASTSSWRRKFPQVGNAVRTEKAISKEHEAALRRGIEEYKKFAQK